MTRGYEIATWLMATLPSPGDVSADLRLTPDQIEFLADLYRLDGSRYVHRRASLSGAKGIGKSPLAAMIAIAVRRAVCAARAAGAGRRPQ